MENSVTLVIGRRGTGKTNFVKRLIRKSPMPKKLVIDTFDSEVWQTMESFDDPDGKNIFLIDMDYSHFAGWKKGLYRLWDSDTKKQLQYIDKFARNTFLVFDDATKYIGSKLEPEIIRFILDSKQKNLNIVLCFHALGKVPTDLFRYSNYVVLHKTNENMTSWLKNKCPKEVVDVFDEVNNHPDKYHRVTVDIAS